jgi:hypothetical protein
MMILSGIEPCRKPHRHSPHQGSEDFLQSSSSTVMSLTQGHSMTLTGLPCQKTMHTVNPALVNNTCRTSLCVNSDALLGIMHSRSVFEWIPSLRTLLVEHGSAMDNSVNHLLELQLSSSNTDIQQQLDRLPS